MNDQSNKRILFAVGELDGVMNANNRIALAVATALANVRGCMCDVAGVAVYRDGEPDERFKPRQEIGSVTIFREAVTDARREERAALRDGYSAFCGARGVGESDRISKGLYALLHPFRALRLFWLGSPRNPELRDRAKRRYVELVRSLDREREYDAIIAVYMPFDMCECLIDADRLPPVYMYQLDPWSLHELELPTSRAKRLRQELKAFCAAGHIFTTPVLLRRYKEPPYDKYADKMTAVEFPNYSPKAALTERPSAVSFDSGFINVLYCGVINDSYRDPKAVLTSLMSICGGKIRVYMIGICQSETARRFADEYPDRVFVLPPVESSACEAAMARASILLNISNTLSNQLPSKLIDYFSTGKPIVSVQKIADCPSLPYLEKYPLAFVYDESREPELLNAELESFIMENAGKTLDDSARGELFRECTPEYVANQIINVIEDRAL